MKRFLSLFLSALVTFQMINVGCDAASHYRNTAPNYNYNSIGGAYQGQPVTIMQSSPYIAQQQPQSARSYCPQPQSPQPTQTVMIPKYVQSLPEKNDTEKKSVLRTVFSILATVVSIGVGILSGAFSLLGNALKSLFSRDNNRSPKKEEKEKDKQDNNQEPQCMDCCEELTAGMNALRESIKVNNEQLNTISQNIEGVNVVTMHMAEISKAMVNSSDKSEDGMIYKFVKYILPWSFKNY